MNLEDTSDRSFNKNSPFVFDCIAPDDVTFDLGSQFLLFKKTGRRIEFFYQLVLLRLILSTSNRSNQIYFCYKVPGEILTFDTLAGLGKIICYCNSFGTKCSKYSKLYLACTTESVG